MLRKISLAMIITALSLSTLISACGGSNATSSSPVTLPTLSGPTLSKDLQPIFNNNCVVCHQGQGQGGLTLEPSKAYANLVNVPSTESPLKRVTPGSPDQSYLVAKLNGTQVQAGGSGAQMPFNSPPLPAAQIDLVKTWITQGAPNN